MVAYLKMLSFISAEFAYYNYKKSILKIIQFQQTFQEIDKDE